MIPKADRTLGYQAYQVEWCSECPKDECGDALLDEGYFVTSISKSDKTQ